MDYARCESFLSWINECNLIDLGFIGPRFTWRGPQWQGMDRVYKRLDRALCNISWRTRFDEAVVMVLPRTNSDHHPLLVTMQGVPISSVNKPFRFEASWIKHTCFPEFLHSVWNQDKPFLQNLDNLSMMLPTWNKDVFGNIFSKKRSLLARLNGIQKALSLRSNPFLENLELALQKEYQQVLSQEELLWFQKSRAEWIKDGDRNTRYYHTKTIIRRRRNKVLSLRNSEGDWIFDQSLLRENVVLYYKNLFHEDLVSRVIHDTRSSFPPIDQNFKDSLTTPVSQQEIKVAIYNIGAFKAPGEDGYPALFYQKNWELLGLSVSSFIISAWENPNMLQQVHNALLVLIPKLEHPEFINQFRPVALCNVIYKCFTNILVNRIKPFLDKIISPFQGSFVPGRNIQDNNIIAKEMFHSMGRMKGRKKFVAIKIDLEKAYDRLNWNFIHHCLSSLGIDNHFISIIMSCISSSSFKVLWNGEKSEYFNPSRGIRQGDPLSSYIFVSCMDYLSHIIADHVIEGSWKPMRAGRLGPIISHLIFADDLLLFVEASIDQMQTILHCLNMFCSASGQKVNANKTSICFSKNVSDNEANGITSCGGFSVSKDIGRYLGAQILRGRVTIGRYNHILDKVQDRLCGWKQQCLSMAGRITLAGSVLGSMATFQMQHEKLLKATCLAIEKAQRQFIWGDSAQQRRVHLINWKILCKPRNAGGLSFKNLSRMNEALLLKIGWKVLTKPRDLWV